MLARRNVYSVPGLGLHGREYARAVFAGLREILRANRNSVREHDRAGGVEPNISPRCAGASRLIPRSGTNHSAQNLGERPRNLADSQRSSRKHSPDGGISTTRAILAWRRMLWERRLPKQVFRRRRNGWYCWSVLVPIKVLAICRFFYDAIRPTGPPSWSLPTSTVSSRS